MVLATHPLKLQCKGYVLTKRLQLVKRNTIDHRHKSGEKEQSSRAKKAETTEAEIECPHIVTGWLQLTLGMTRQVGYQAFLRIFHMDFVITFTEWILNIEWNIYKHWWYYKRKLPAILANYVSRLPLRRWILFAINISGDKGKVVYWRFRSY